MYNNSLTHPYLPSLLSMSFILYVYLPYYPFSLPSLASPLPSSFLPSLKSLHLVKEAFSLLKFLSPSLLCTSICM